MMLVHRLLASFVGATLVGCAHQSVLTPSELNTHAAEYDGKRVTVHGWLVVEFERYHLSDSETAYNDPNAPASTCVSYLGPIENRTKGKMVTLTGTFWKDFTKSLNVIDLGTCNTSGLDVDNQAPANPKKSN